MFEGFIVYGCPNKFGPECYLTCHCNATSCDPNTGECSDGKCLKPYNTDGDIYYCQRKDIAYRKPCTASSQFERGMSWHPNNVVDDDLEKTQEPQTCYSSLGVPAWLQVDLQGLHPVKWLRLRNRFHCCAYRMNGFRIYLSNTSTSQLSHVTAIEQHRDFVLCYQHPGGISHIRTPTSIQGVNITKDGYIHIECVNKPYIRAQFVIVYLPKLPDNQYLHFCQLNIYECSPGTYGRFCNVKCSCANRREICDTVTGHCPNGCALGVSGIDCKTLCTANSWGYDCGNRCHCRENVSCDPVQGHCPNDICASGYMEKNCSISVPVYVVGIIVACLCVLFITVIVIVVICIRRRLRHSSPGSMSTSNSEYLEPQINHTQSNGFEMSAPPYVPPAVDDGYETFTSKNDNVLYTQLEPPYIEATPIDNPDGVYLHVAE